MRDTERQGDGVFTGYITKLQILADQLSMQATVYEQQADHGRAIRCENAARHMQEAIRVIEETKQ